MITTSSRSEVSLYYDHGIVMQRDNLYNYFTSFEDALWIPLDEEVE